MSLRRSVRSARRRAAEARSAARKLQRVHRAEAEVLLAQAARRRFVRQPDPLARLLPTIRRLFGLGKVARRLRVRTEAVFAALSTEIGGLCRSEELPWAMLLAAAPWWSPPRSFRAPDGDLDERRRALLRHLLGPFPVPLFLARALQDVSRLAIARTPDEDVWLVTACAWIARGRSLRAAVGHWLPAGFTRAMCHAFATTPGVIPPVEALRRAQVEGLGGPAAFARALLRTELGRWLGPDREARWHAILGQVCARGALTAWRGDDVRDLVSWLDAAAADPAFSLSGRTEASIRAHVDAHRWLRAADGARAGRCGIPGFREGGITIRELRSEQDLRREGQRMQHCVALYVPLVKAGKVAVFAVTGPDVSATVEVVTGLRRIAQVKGRANRPPCPAARRAVARWAAANGLEGAERT